MSAKNALCILLVVACLMCLSSCGPLDPAEQLELEGSGEVFVVKLPYCNEIPFDPDNRVQCQRGPRPDAGFCELSDSFGTVRNCTRLSFSSGDAGVLP